MKVSFRQGIVSYQTDTDGSMQFLVGDGVGSGVTLYVSPTPTIVNFAHGDANYLFTESRTVVDAWAGPFDQTKDHYLYWDINPKTGVRTFGSTTVTPTASSKPPVHTAPGAHWFDTTRNTMYEWVGVWNPVIRVFAAKYKRGSTFESMSTVPNKKSFSGSQAGVQTRVSAGAIMFDAAGAPLKSSKGTFYTTEDGFATGVPSSASVKIESVLIEGIADEALPRFSAVYFSDFERLKLANHYSPANKVVGIVMEDAYRSKLVQIVTNGLVTNPEWSWKAPNKLIYIDATGKLVDEPIVALQLPIGIVVNSSTIALQVPIAASAGQGPLGPQGVAGPKGEKGEQGGVGPVGPRGEVGMSAYDSWLNQGNRGTEAEYIESLKGAQGSVGPQGPQGLPGPAGAVGAQGEKGDAGEAGPKGDTGEMGPQGIQGEAGPQGDKGDVGEAGPKGDTGEAGPKGDTGPAGIQGSIGPEGPVGPAGEAGAVGEAGPKGDKGDTGAVGPKGDAGAIGPVGLPGPKGDKGDKGDAGLANRGAWAANTSYLVGDYVTYASVQYPGHTGLWMCSTTVTSTTTPDLDASHWNELYSVEGPVGPQGPQGEKGDAGIQGSIGTEGPAGPAGVQGPVGPAGPKGDTGAASTIPGPQGLQGPMGPAGTKGDKGDTGATGPKGDTGAIGPAGPQGPTGADSIVPGPMGPAGAKGDTGATGPQGGKGDTGAVGPKGDTGATGPQGIQGTAGVKGDTGAIGPQGAQGPIGPQGPKGDAGPVGAQGIPGTNGATTITALTDVFGAPQNGNTLVYNGTTSKWEPQTIAASSGPSGAPVGDIYNNTSRYFVESTPGITVQVTSSATVRSGISWTRVGTTMTLTRANHGHSVGDRVIVRNSNVDMLVALVTSATANGFTVTCDDTGFSSGSAAAYSMGFTFAHNAAVGSISGGTLSAPAGGNVVLLSLRMHLAANTRGTQTYNLAVPASLSNGVAQNTSTDDMWIPVFMARSDVNTLGAINATISVNPSSAGYSTVQFIALPLPAAGMILMLQY